MTTLSTLSAPAVVRYLVLASVCLSCAACSKKGVPLYPIHGRILLDGKPMAGAMVVLHPQADVGLDGFKPRALADADGWFNIYTFKIGDGAPAGQYAVTIQPKKPKQEHGTAKSKGAKRQAHASAKATQQAASTPATKIAKADKPPKTLQKKQKVRERDASSPARYREPATSGLQIEVKEEANELAPFQLQSSQEESTPE